MLKIRGKLGEPVSRKSMKEKKKIQKPSVRKYANHFVAYGGYIQELDMFVNDGYYFKTYLLDESVFGKLFANKNTDEALILDRQTGEVDFLEPVLHLRLLNNHSPVRRFPVRNGFRLWQKSCGLNRLPGYPREKRQRKSGRSALSSHMT